MGFTPAEVGAMSLWEFLACCDGYLAAKTGRKRPGKGDMTEDRLAELGIEGF